MENYFVYNAETGKIELHFEKDIYQALPEESKKSIKSSFLWGRRSGCWISRAKFPNLYWPRECAKSLGLVDGGTVGERRSYAEQMEEKAEKAERRAERYENRAAAAETRAEELQKPIRDMHGDISFFTQPNINTSAGRSFTRRRERMFESFEKGFEEYNKSAYWKERAAVAKNTAAMAGLNDKAFVGRRIAEREKDIRALKRSLDEFTQILEKSDRDGGEPVDRYGTKLSRDRIESNIERWTDMLEAKLDELGFYQDCMDRLGGVKYSKDTVKIGDRVKIRGCWGTVAGRGPKNVKFVDDNWPFAMSYPYAEIQEYQAAN